MNLQPIHHINTPTEDDYGVIVSGINQYAASRGLPGTNAGFWMAYDDEKKPIAALSSFDNFGPLEISGLWIDEKYRGQGYGRALMQKAEEWARQRGCKMMTVFTIKDWPACAWYQQQGFTIEHERPGHVNGTVGCYLIKRL